MSLVHETLSSTYGRTLRALYSRSGLPWTVHDEVVRIHPAVRHLVPHEPEPALFQFLRRTIRPGDVVLDVGAFVGIYAVLEARWSAPSGRVVAFEPTPSSVEIAHRHLEWNRASDRVHLIEAAVSDRPRAPAAHYEARRAVCEQPVAASTPQQNREARIAVVTTTTVRSCTWCDGHRRNVQGAEIHGCAGA